MLKDKRKIDGLWYYAGVWYADKAEAQAKAARLRKSGQFKNVRVIQQLVLSPKLFMSDKIRYWIYTR